MSDQTEATEQTGVPPLSDEIHDVAERIVRRYPVARSALLPLLHLVQSEQNHITDEGVAFCAEKVGLTRAEVGAVATFYTMYKREPVGDWLLSVCTNPPCKIAGGQEIYENYVEALGGHRDPETRVTVEHAECLGICDGAPVVQVNYEMFGPMTVDEGQQLLESCRKGEPPVSPWSGEKPPTFNELERDLSGANDAWEAQLHRAALQQIAYDSPPTYRTGETDIPVTHPGGDPAGVGGALFRQAAAGTDGDRAHRDVPTDPADVPDTADVVADRDPAPGDPDQRLAGGDAQRIAPGEADDTSIAAAGPGAPDAPQVEVHPPRADDDGVEPLADAPAMTTEPGPTDQPGDVGVLGGERPAGQQPPPTDQDAGSAEGDGDRDDASGYADDPDQEHEDAAGTPESDTEGRTPSTEADVAPGKDSTPTADAAAQGLPTEAGETVDTESDEDDGDDGSDRSDEERSDEPGGEAASDDQASRPKGDG